MRFRWGWGFLLLGLAACGELEGWAPGWLESQAIGGKVYGNFQIQPDLPEADGPRPAVQLTYLMTDEVINRNAVSQSDQSLKMLQTMDGWVHRATHHLVFRDGDRNGDSRLYYLQQPDPDLATIRAPQSPLAPGVGEVQSNNPQVLAEVLSWTLDHYPGQRKYLHLYTHGGGVRGIGTDSTQTDPAGQALKSETRLMRLHQLGQALRQGLKGRQLDLIYYQSCLMGNLEALYEQRGLVHYVVASEAVSFRTANAGLTLPTLLHQMREANQDPAQIARALAIQGYAKSGTTPDGQKSGFDTLAAFDLSRVDELKTAINRLALALIAQLKQNPGPILQAYDATHAFDGKEPQVDLWHFTQVLAQYAAAPSIQSAVQEVREAQRRFMLHERDSLAFKANGLSIFLPPRGIPQNPQHVINRLVKQVYPNCRFAQETAWDDFIQLALQLR